MEMLALFDPCFCGSPLPYRFCCGVRSLFPQMKAYEGDRWQSPFRDCLHGGSTTRCGLAAIESHTVSRRASLGMLAEDHQIRSMGNPSLQQMEKVHGGLTSTELIAFARKQPIASASTLPLFCADHDANLFPLLDAGEGDVTPELIWEMHYRATAFELRKKQQTELFLEEMRREVIRGKHRPDQEAGWKDIGQRIRGQTAGVKDGIAEVDACLKAKNVGTSEALDWCHWETRPTTLALAAAGGFTPWKNLDGQLLFDLSDPQPLPQMSLTVQPYGGRSIFVLCWRRRHGACRSLVDTLRERVEDDSRWLTRMVFSRVESVYMRPSWWEGLGDDSRIACFRLLQEYVTPERTPAVETLAGAVPDGLGAVSFSSTRSTLPG